MCVYVVHGGSTARAGAVGACEDMAPLLAAIPPEPWPLPAGRADAVLDALEDTTAEFLWKWEARDMKAVPKALKPAAAALKKRLAEVRCPARSHG